MKTLSRHQHHTLMDAGLPPAVRVESGEPLAIETLDACYGRARSMEEFVAFRDGPDFQPDPLAGPVYVVGAAAGAGMFVDILKVQLEQTGFQLIGPNRAIVRDEIGEWDYYRVEIQDDRIHLPRGLTLPVAPVIGTLGNAPASGPTNRPNRLGGNLDCPQIRPGVRVYLPVDVAGGMFFLGDVHARQGDGEVVGAPEIGAAVTVQFGVIEQPAANWPLVEDEDHWHFVTSAASEEAALRIGVFEAASFVSHHYHVSRNDALVLLTMCVSLRCSRTGGWGDLERVICTSVPKQLIEQATNQPSPRLGGKVG